MNMPKTMARKPNSWRGVTPIQASVPGGTSEAFRGTSSNVEDWDISGVH